MGEIQWPAQSLDLKFTKHLWVNCIVRTMSSHPLVPDLHTPALHFTVWYQGSGKNKYISHCVLYFTFFTRQHRSSLVIQKTHQSAEEYDLHPEMSMAINKIGVGGHGYLGQYLWTGKLGWWAIFLKKETRWSIPIIGKSHSSAFQTVWQSNLRLGRNNAQTLDFSNTFAKALWNLFIQTRSALYVWKKCMTMCCAICHKSQCRGTG